MKLFFATDLHGSTTCFKKFLAAKKFYGVDYLILGGDLSGKSLTIIRKNHNNYTIDHDHNLTLHGTHELDAYMHTLETEGVYYTIAEPDEHVDITRMHKQKIAERRRQRGDLAEKTDVQIYGIAGNDDSVSLDKTLSQSAHFTLCNETCIETDEFNIVGFSYVTPTPRDTPREATEEQIAGMLQGISMPQNQKPLIINCHVPPKNIGLDTVLALDKELRPIMTAGGYELTYAGSDAVKKYVLEKEPVLGLFGHVHECRYATNLGKTLCINPGSVAQSGKLQGAVIGIDDKKITSRQLTEG